MLFRFVHCPVLTRSQEHKDREVARTCHKNRSPMPPAGRIQLSLRSFLNFHAPVHVSVNYFTSPSATSKEVRSLRRSVSMQVRALAFTVN